MTDRYNGATTEGRDAAGRFAQGNPGRPKGSRHRVTEAVEALLDGEAEALTRTAIERALGGDMVALRLCLERVAPARKDRPVTFELPPINTTADLVRAGSALLAAVAEGEITPTEAQAMAALIAAHAKTLELHNLEARIAQLEKERQ